MKKRASKYRIEVHQGDDARYYWRLVAPNGNIMARCDEGRVRRGDAVRQARRIAKIMADAEIVKV
jgi:uncharacterized protein YegP (UPF0339 family)